MSGSEDFQSADKANVTAVEAKASTNALDEARTFWESNISSSMRQAAVAADGWLIGGLKTIPHELSSKKLPGTAFKAGCAVGGGLVFGALLAAESPAIVVSAVGIGILLLGKSVYDTGSKFAANKDLVAAFDAVKRSSSSKVFSDAMKKAEVVMGSESFDYGLGFLAGGASLAGARTGISSFLPYFRFTCPGTPLFNLRGFNFSDKSFIVAPTKEQQVSITNLVKDLNETFPELQIGHVRAGLWGHGKELGVTVVDKSGRNLKTRELEDYYDPGFQKIEAKQGMYTELSAYDGNPYGFIKLEGIPGWQPPKRLDQ